MFYKYRLKSFCYEVYNMVEDKESPSQRMILHLEEIAKKAPKVDKSKFIGFHYVDANGEAVEAYVHPQRFEKSPRNYYHGSFVKLFYLAKRLGEINGLNLTFPNTHAASQIVLSKETEEFRRTNPSFSTYNNLIIRKIEDEVEVRKVEDANFEDRENVSYPTAIIVENKGVLGKFSYVEKILQEQIFAPKILQRSIPTRDLKPRYFDEFKGVLPVDAELTKKPDNHKGVWDGCKFDDQGLAIVKTEGKYSEGHFHLSTEECSYLMSMNNLILFTKEKP